MIEQQTKEYEKFSKFYSAKDQVFEKFIRSNTFLPFGLESLKYPTIFTESVPSGAPAATDFKHIFINPNDKFFSDINVDTNSGLTFAFLHEIAHNIFDHKARGEGKDPHLWGYATDYFINLFLWNLEKENKDWDEQANLIVMKLDVYTDKILFNQKFSGMIEEEIYDKLQSEGKFEKKEEETSYKDFLDDVGLPNNSTSPDSKIKITKTKLEFDGKVEKKVFIEFPKGEGDEQTNPNSQMDSALAKTMFESRVVSRGFQSSDFEKFIKRIFQVKVDWSVILRDSLLTDLSKTSDIIYGRPRLVWLANPINLPYLPNITEEEIYGTIIIAIDESGSVNDSDISKAVEIINQSSSYYKDIIVMKHDVKISWEKKFNGILTEKDIDELSIRKSCGGTSHKDVFNRIIELSKQNDNVISIIICVSDLFSDIEENQKILSSSIPRIYIRSNKEYNSEKIVGKIINIE